MVGQGRPLAIRSALVRRCQELRWPLRTVRCIRVVAIACGIVAAASLSAAQNDSLGQSTRVRIVFQGVEPHLCSGTVRLEGGTLDDLQLLGSAPDSAAAVWLDGNTIHFRPTRPRRSDGVNVTVTGTADARLIVEMKADATTAAVTREISLAEVLRDQVRLPLDERGNTLLVRQAPSDALRIVTERESLIFAPGEQFFTFDVQPQVAEIAPSTSIDIDVTMSSARSDTTLWNHHQQLLVPIEGPAVATFHVPLPQQEGVYEIHVAVSRSAGYSLRFLPRARNKPLVKRSFQFVVLDAAPTEPTTDASWQTVLEIDPTSSRWWERLPRLPNWTRRIPGVSPRPLGSLRAETSDDPLGRFVRLPPTAAGGEPHWQAYPLPIEAVGVPHLLEVEYPNDQEQHLGFSILEPNAAGVVVPVGRDSGVYVEGIGHAEQIEKHRHRLVFWPRTDSPLLLVTNQHPTAAARFGHIRVLKRTSSSIAAEPWATSPPTGRLVAAYLSRPLLPETFGATAGRDDESGEALDDWQTFYESTTRLAEYLNFAGYNAAVVSVLADGSSLFPSRRLLPTPLYNSGHKVGGTRDLPGVDPLELQLQVFDRSGLALVPTLQFATPLPDLESLRRGRDAKTSGLELVGPAGITWTEMHTAQRGLAPYYNLLDDRVQQAMLDVVRDLVDRYGHHPSLAGLAVQLTGDGYAMLPGLEWGLDDTTVARFSSDTGVWIPNDVPNRFAVRQRLLLGKHADAWRDWRAARVTEFYRQLAAIIRSNNPQRHLLLTTEEMFATADLAERFRPNVSAPTPRIDRTMRDLGIDRASLADTAGVVLCPTQYVESMAPLVDRAIGLEISKAFAAASKQAAGAPYTALAFYHPPQRRRLASFDAKSPFDSSTQLVVQSSADAARGRRPYATMFRDQDPVVLLDGGELLPLGQEDATRHLRRILQQLPIDATSTIERAENVTVRSYATPQGTICVVVNECPWQADIELTLDVPTPAEAKPLVREQETDAAVVPAHFDVGSQLWPLQLAAYDVVAVRFSTSDVGVEKIVSTVSETGRRELAARLADLRDRDLTATQLYLGLQNPGFEPTPGGLSGWRLVGGAGHATTEFDATAPPEGRTSLLLQNTANKKVATLESNAFVTPPTGQMVMTVWVRAENVDPDTQLRLVFETDEAGLPYRRYAVLDANRPASKPLNADWQHYAFRSEDLPLDSRSEMRVKFELAGAGSVWIDDVKLHDVLFPLSFYEPSRQERLELVKLIHSADAAEESGKLSECVELLEGYWPRFLTEYTPVVQRPIVKQPANQAAPPNPPAKQREVPEVGGWWRFWKR